MTRVLGLLRARWSAGEPWPWLRWAGLLLLAGYLLFAHPCHGDEDTELVTRFWIGD